MLPFSRRFSDVAPIGPVRRDTKTHEANVLNILIAVCTYQRPLMVRRCLESIVSQRIPSDWQIRVVVVENNSEPTLKAFVAQISCPAQMEIHHVCEPQLGISFARNAALREARAYVADWLIFIDDDEEAEANWLIEYANALANHNAEIIHGGVDYRYSSRDGWSCLLNNSAAKIHARDGRLVHSAATDNVMISRKLFIDWQMQFDIKLAFSGGEDTEFFNRARLRGARIVFCAKPVVSTLVVTERESMRWLFVRESRIGAVGVYIDKKHQGVNKTFRKHAGRCARGFLQGLLYVLFSPIAFLKGKNNFRIYMLRGVARLGRAWGGFIGLQGKLITPYKKSDGH